MHFNDRIRHFDDYLMDARTIITRANNFITDTAKEDILDSIAPKAFYPKNQTDKTKGILLIHGLLDSCAIMSSLYDYYAQKGYLVKTILLPGHGTCPADLFDVKWEEWVKCCDFAIKSFRKEVRTLDVLALSAGACLASYFALNNAPIDKLVLFAPAFKLKIRSTWLVRACQTLNNHLPFPLKKWIMQQEENALGKYRSIAVNGVYQLLELMDRTTPRLLKEQLRQPVFIILSGDDETISNEKAMACFKAQRNPQNQLLLFANEDVTFKEENIECLPSCLPDEGIVNFSHICLTVAPDHALFGKQKEDASHYLGANTPSNLINYHYRFKRLSFNPHFDKMLKRIDAFLETDTE